MMLKVGLLAVLSIVLFGESDGTCISESHVNGCSVPLNSPFPYKKVFEPACHKHDVCYRCVSTFLYICNMYLFKLLLSLCEYIFIHMQHVY